MSPQSWLIPTKARGEGEAAQPTRSQHQPAKTGVYALMSSRAMPSPPLCFDLEDLRDCLAAGEGAEQIADFLCRSVEEVRAKTAEIAAA